MFENITLNAGELLLILFTLILLFIIVYGAISIRSVKQLKAR